MSLTHTGPCGHTWDADSATCPVCGVAGSVGRLNTVDEAPPTEAPLLPQGTRLKDRYVLRHVLGQGGMGVVYLGTDELLQRPVAVKMIRPRDPELWQRTVCQDGLRDAFLAEARIGAQLTHAAIGTVFDFGFHERQPFTVFEYVGGATLRELLERRGPLPVADARLILAPLAQALDFAHRRQVVHRDLKPENLRATEQGAFKVLDLGLAREFRRDLDWRFAGTPAYAAPEQARGLPCDGRTDQYALALIAFEMLTGRRPFAGNSAAELLDQHATAAVPDPRPLRPDLPESMARALLRALSKDPAGRFSTCEAFALALGCALLSEASEGQGILRLARLKKLKGGGHRPGWTRTLGDGAPHAALDAEALWTWDCGEVRRVPRAALRKAEAKKKNLYLEVATAGTPVPLTLTFASAAECKRWRGDLVTAECQPLEGWEQTRRNPVVVLEGRPPGRYQALGRVECEAADRRTADVGMQLQAALLGADAVVEPARERVVQEGRTVRRAAGTALRAVDEAGRVEVRTHWFRAELNRLLLVAAIVTGAFLSLTLLGTIVSRLLVWLTPEGPSAGAAALEVAVVTLVLATPLLFVLLTRWLRWPQLLGPLQLALAAPGVMALGQNLGLGWAVWRQGVGRGMQVALLLAPLGPMPIAMLLTSAYLVWRARRLRREYRVVLGTAQPRTAPRRVVTGLCWAVVAGSAAAVLVQAAASGYELYGQMSVLSLERHLERRAQAEEEEGDRAAEAGRWSAAAQHYQQAASDRHRVLWQQDDDPEARAAYAATLEKLAHAQFRAGDRDQATSKYREALYQFDLLCEPNPQREDWQERRQRVRDASGLLYCLDRHELIARNYELQCSQAVYPSYWRSYVEQVVSTYRDLRQKNPQAMESAELAPARLLEARCLTDLAELLPAGEAEPLYRRALAALEPRRGEGEDVRRPLARAETGLAWCKLMQEEPGLQERSQALGHAQRGVADGDDDGFGWLAQALAYCRLGNDHEARNALAEAAKPRGDGDPFDWLVTALVEARAGQRDEALEWRNRAARWLGVLKALEAWRGAPRSIKWVFPLMPVAPSPATPLRNRGLPATAGQRQEMRQLIEEVDATLFPTVRRPHPRAVAEAR